MKKIQKLDDITAADWENIKRRREQGANLDQVGVFTRVLLKEER